MSVMIISNLESKNDINKVEDETTSLVRNEIKYIKSFMPTSIPANKKLKGVIDADDQIACMSTKKEAYGNSVTKVNEWIK